MGLLSFVVLSLFLGVYNLPAFCSEDVTLTIRSVTTIARTDNPFICATMDWWPKDKCNYGMCPWDQASIINLDLSNPILPKAIGAFNPLRIRVGGSLQDQVIYKLGRLAKNCHDFRNSSTGLFGFSKGCLTLERWDALNDLFTKSKAVITFGLNALIGRQKPKNPNDIQWTGPWNTRNARDLIQYTNYKGYNIDSWELGNELCAGGVSAKVDPLQYGKDVIALKKIVTRLNTGRQQRVLAPGGFFDADWFKKFLQASGPNVVDAVTHHIYNLGPGGDPTLIHKMQDPFVLDNSVHTYKDVEVTLDKFGPWADAWNGETGGAYNSGGKESHTFVDSFWYLDQLGQASKYNHKVFCRQSLIGGNYGLLNTTTMAPNPDYYSALLFHRLMGEGVLQTTHDGSPYLRAYSHCSNKKPGVTLLLINLSNSTQFNINVKDDFNTYPPDGTVFKSQQTEGSTGQREEYRLIPKDGILTSQTMLLNGKPLEITSAGEIPPLNPTYVDASAPLQLSPSSIAFVTLRDFIAPACS